MVTKAIELPEGLQIELLTVIERIENKNGRSNYLCKCSCGRKCEALGKKLKAALENRKGSKKSCGCLVPMISSTHALTDEKDLVGKKFGRLLVIKRNFHRYGIDKHTSYYDCQCDCGNIKIIARKHLVSNEVVSCGCRKKEIQEEFVKKYAQKKIFTKETLKICSLCKKEKKCEEFFKQLHKFTSHCKECYKEKNKRNEPSEMV